jgi:hypothetical protein
LNCAVARPPFFLDTDWQSASITHATAQQMRVRGSIERQAAWRFVLTEQGRAVPAAVLERCLI